MAVKIGSAGGQLASLWQFHTLDSIWSQIASKYYTHIAHPLLQLPHMPEPASRWQYTSPFDALEKYLLLGVGTYLEEP